MRDMGGISAHVYAPCSMELTFYVAGSFRFFTRENFVIVPRIGRTGTKIRPEERIQILLLLLSHCSESCVYHVGALSLRAVPRSARQP